MIDGSSSYAHSTHQRSPLRFFWYFIISQKKYNWLIRIYFWIYLTYIVLVIVRATSILNTGYILIMRLSETFHFFTFAGLHFVITLYDRPDLPRVVLLILITTFAWSIARPPYNFLRRPTEPFHSTFLLRRCSSPARMTHNCLPLVYLQYLLNEVCQSFEISSTHS